MAKDKEPPSCQKEIGLVQKLGELMIEALQKYRTMSVEINYCMKRSIKQEYSAAVPFYFFYDNNLEIILSLKS